MVEIMAINVKSPQDPNPENKREDNLSCEIFSVRLRKSHNLTPSVNNFVEKKKNVKKVKLR